MIGKGVALQITLHPPDFPDDCQAFEFRRGVISFRRLTFDLHVITFFPSSYCCVSTAPRPAVLASVCNMNRFEKFGQTRTGAEINFPFSVLKAFSCSSPHTQRAFFFVSRVSGAAIPEKPAMNRRYHEAIPINCRICLTVRDSGQSATVLTFSGSV